MSSALPRITRLPSVRALRSRTVSTASPCRSSEFIHSTGSSERETTYFVLRSSTCRTGLSSGCCVQALCIFS